MVDFVISNRKVEQILTSIFNDEQRHKNVPFIVNIPVESLQLPIDEHLGTFTLCKW